LAKLNQNQITALKNLEKDCGERLFSRLNDLFESEAPKSFASMHQSLFINDLVSLSKHAHKLKSSCHNLGADAMAEICKEIELNARQKLKLDYEKLIKKLEESFPEIIKELRAYE
jgi:HPt (histidine-containing phosphotransfer) domain-containing protein